MYFTSPAFFCFFAAFLLGIWLLRSHEHKVLWLVAGGAVFYAVWDWRFLALLAFVSIFEFQIVQRIDASVGVVRKRWLTLDIVVNLSLLGYFKYANFFVDSLSAMLGPKHNLGHLTVVLPIGISFFTFEAMSYATDVYRGKLKPFTSWSTFAAFIFFFPRMIAGPIIRASDFLPQLLRPIQIRRENVVQGASQFALGLTKKLVIADRVAPVADTVFANPLAYAPVSLWQGVLAYGVQIYCDFSGYSDMAIGVAKILGFDLPPNFALPYLATSLDDFWRRWHISLSTWLRDYLYISLGGNRGGVWLTYRNLFLTMLLGGLWHGASWTFVVWGAVHGIGLACERMTRDARRRLGGRVPRWAALAVGWTTCQLFVWLAWVVFRAPTIQGSRVFLLRLFDPSAEGIRWCFAPLWGALVLIAAGHLIGSLWGLRPLRALWAPTFRARLLWCVWGLGILYFGVTRNNGFIYFQF